MPSRRITRINELLLREISAYVLENQPPDTGLITFLAVHTTDDLATARVFYSVLGTEEERARAAESLDRMRYDLGRSMRRLESLRRLPHLTFVFDDTPARAARVHEIIEDLKDPGPPPGPPPARRKRA